MVYDVSERQQAREKQQDVGLCDGGGRALHGLVRRLLELLHLLILRRGRPGSHVGGSKCSGCCCYSLWVLLVLMVVFDM